jgi:hypothetical protein
MPPVDLDQAIFWSPPVAAAVEPDNATQKQLCKEQSRYLRLPPEPEGLPVPMLPREDTDHGPSLRNSNADVVVISDDDETSNDDDHSTAACDSDDNNSNPAGDDSDVSYPDIDEVLRRGRLGESHLLAWERCRIANRILGSPSEVLDLTYNDLIDRSADDPSLDQLFQAARHEDVGSGGVASMCTPEFRLPKGVPKADAREQAGKGSDTSSSADDDHDTEKLSGGDSPDGESASTQTHL